MMPEFIAKKMTTTGGSRAVLIPSYIIKAFGIDPLKPVRIIIEQTSIPKNSAISHHALGCEVMGVAA